MGIFILAGILSWVSGANAGTFSYDDLVGLIQSKNLKTMEETLAVLPVDLLSHYDLMKTSQSLQDASPDNPRVILFGANAKLTCSFNGDSSQRGSDVLECIQFRDSERAFDFRQIQFPTHQNGLTAVRYSARGKSADGKVSCSACHTADPRPNWHEYFTWPGAYGARDDDLSGDTDYPRFVSLRASHPRYRYLIQENTPSAPFFASFDANPAHRPGLFYSDFSNKWNAFRVARILKSKVSGNRLIAFALSALNCRSSSDGVVQQLFSQYDFENTLRTDLILQATALPKETWATIFTRVGGDSDRNYYFYQAGFTTMGQTVAMVIAQDLANEGNLEMKTAIQNFASHPSDYATDYPQFAAALNAINPEAFLRWNDEGESPICHGLANVFLKSVSAAH